MTEQIIQRILRQAQAPDLIEILVDRMCPSDLQSVLLEVYRRRVDKLAPSRLLRQYERNRFVRPAQVDREALLRQVETQQVHPAMAAHGLWRDEADLAALADEIEANRLE